MRAIRRQKRWSQLRLAHELSVSERTIRNWENGYTEPNVRDLLLFRALLQASMGGVA